MRALHVLVYVGCAALCGFALLQLVPPAPLAVVLWFGGTIVGHDLILLPLHQLLDRGLVSVLPRSLLNHVRVPAALSALALVVFLPLILRVPGVPRAYAAASGRAVTPYLGHWLLLTAILFGGSAVALAVRALRGRGRVGRARVGRRRARPVARSRRTARLTRP